MRRINEGTPLFKTVTIRPSTPLADPFPIPPQPPPRSMPTQSLPAKKQRAHGEEMKAPPS